MKIDTSMLIQRTALQVTAPTQKAGFRASQTHLCKPKVQFSE